MELEINQLIENGEEDDVSKAARFIRNSQVHGYPVSLRRNSRNSR